MKTNEIETYQEIQNFIQQKDNEFYCKFGKQSTLICFNKICTNNSFICSAAGCQCKTQHLKCIKTEAKTFMKSVRQKPKKIEKFKNILEQKIADLFNCIQIFRDNTIHNLDENFEFFGKTQVKRHLLNQNTQHKITGNKIWSIIENLQKKQEVKKIAKQTLKKLNDCFIEATKLFGELQSQTVHQPDQCNLQDHYCLRQKEKQRFDYAKNIDLKSFDSKIVTNLNELHTLLRFFDQRIIKSANLLYRASQNDFEVSKFHQNCDGFGDTIILIHTDKDAKIGGYTPIKWKSNGKYPPDQQKLSFIFSLTQGDKLQLKNGREALEQRQGPAFGGLDLFICDKANINENYSCAVIDRSYTNEKYECCGLQKLSSFSGNVDTIYFSTKQWQVWKLEFEDQFETK